MKEFSRVLAAVDFSKPGRDAFEYALALSKDRGAELVVVQAVPPTHAFSWEGRARLTLAEKLRRKAETANVELMHRVQHGNPAKTILLHASSLEPDVIVVGTHQRKGIDRLRVRSVAERVAANATVPVLIVPADRQARAIGPFRHLAVAVDFSAASDRAIEQALAIGGGAAERITLVHVVPGFSAGPPRQLYRFGVAEYQDQLIREARRRLQFAMPANPAVEFQTIVMVGDTTTEIVRAVDTIGADVLLLGVPKRGVVSRALFGTTTARLFRAARVPILAVPESASAITAKQRGSLQLAA